MTTILGTFAVKTSGATHTVTVPAGVTPAMSLLLALGTNDNAMSAGTALASPGATFTPLDERAANNMSVTVWTGTGLTAGNTLTVTLGSAETPVIHHVYTDDYTFSSGAGNVAVGTRGGVSSASTTSGSLTPTAGQPVWLVALERTTAPPTTVSSVVSSGGETVTQVDYQEAATDPAVSVYFGRFVASAAAARTATITYSGASGNGYAALVRATATAAATTYTKAGTGAAGGAGSGGKVRTAARTGTAAAATAAAGPDTVQATSSTVVAVDYVAVAVTYLPPSAPTIFKTGPLPA